MSTKRSMSVIVAAFLAPVGTLLHGCMAAVCVFLSEAQVLLRPGADTGSATVQKINAFSGAFSTVWLANLWTMGVLFLAGLTGVVMFLRRIGPGRLVLLVTLLCVVVAAAGTAGWIEYTVWNLGDVQPLYQGVVVVGHVSAVFALAHAAAAGASVYQLRTHTTGTDTSVI